MIEHHPGLAERLEPKPGEPGRRVFQYYVSLLHARRKTLKIEQLEFRKHQGRDPEFDELPRLADQLQRALGERGRLLATKPSEGTDEVLVYLAVEHALRTGKQTLILTRDADIEEQLFKLLWLIETHYRAMLLADRYVEQFGTFRIYPVPDSVLNHPSGPFEPRDAVLVERDPDMRDVLPPNPHPVAISCMNAGVYFSHLAFMAETEMGRLLDIKDRTGGLSTERLGERNMHASISPVPLGRGRDYAAVVHDKRVPLFSDGTSVTGAPGFPTADCSRPTRCAVRALPRARARQEIAGAQPRGPTVSS